MTSRNPLDSLFTRQIERPSDLLCCAFGLRTSEIDAYFSLMAGPKTVGEIARAIRRDRSTVQRVLKKLVEAGLAVREVRHLPRGGYYYVYQAVSSDAVREQVLELLEKWYERTKKIILESWPRAT